MELEANLVLKTQRFLNHYYPDPSQFTRDQINMMRLEGKHFYGKVKDTFGFLKLTEHIAKVLSDKRAMGNYNAQLTSKKERKYRIRPIHSLEYCKRYAVLFLLTRHPSFEGEVSL